MTKQHTLSPTTARPEARDAVLTEIALRHSGGSITTLETRRDDDLDFYELGIWNIRKMLQDAFDAGRKAAR